MKNIPVLLLILIYLSSCLKEYPNEIFAEENTLDKESAVVSAAKKADNITICHQQPNGSWQLRSISINSWPTHQAHGDVRLDDQDRDGYVPNNSCGYGSQGDCDDNNSLILPGVAEICNGIDDNCNGVVDESCYNAVVICDQVWMTENLNVSVFRNGEPIPGGPSVNWILGNQDGIAWCHYGNDANNNAIYGKLYNWNAVNDVRGLPPEGWHIPSENEWYKLLRCLDPLTDTANGSQTFSLVAGGPLKEAGLTHWLFPNTGATNSTGFTGLPGGWRDDEGTFSSQGIRGFWWSSSGSPYNTNPQGGGGPGNARGFMLSYDLPYVHGQGKPASYGMAVRCVRDR